MLNPPPKTILLPHPVGRDDCPPLWKIDEYKFQRMSRELLSLVESVTSAREFGKRGEKQFGIDIIANTSNLGEHFAAQCKRYKEFTASDIRAASDEFLKHWEDCWSEQGVTRFYLIVSCDLSSTKTQKAILDEEARFQQCSVEYHVWDQYELTSRLRSNRNLVETYIGQNWASEICGEVQRVVDQSLNTTTSARSLQVYQADSLIGILSEDASSRLDSMKETFRSGDTNSNLEAIEDLKADTARWSLLSHDVKAKYVRFQACLCINKKELQLAAHFALEAKRLDSDFDDTALQALLTYYRSGASEALQILDKPLPDKESVNIRGSILLECNRLNELDLLFEQYKPLMAEDAEALRIQGLAHRLRGEFERARQFVDMAFSHKPCWTNVRIARAQLLFESALSPGFRSAGLAFHAEVIDWPFIKRDQLSTDSIRKAHQIYEDLLQQEDVANPDLRAYLECCKLGCLACDFERQSQADDYCTALLQRDPEHSLALLWALGRGYAKDTIQAAARHLEELWRNHKVRSHHIESLVMCYLTLDRPRDALALLKKSKGFLKSNGARQLWLIWRVQCLAQMRKTSQALKLLDEIKDPSTCERLHNALLAANPEDTKSFDEAISRNFGTFKETGSGRHLFTACVLLARADRWEELYEQIESLIEHVGTWEAIRMCALASFNTENYEECLTLIKTHVDKFPNESLPLELVEMRARCHLILGEVQSAYSSAESLYEQDPSPNSAKLLIETLHRKGDFGGLESLARKEIARSDVHSAIVLNLSEILIGQNPELSKALYRRAISEKITDNLVAPAYTLAYRLGIERDASAIHHQFSELASNPSSGILLVRIPEFVEQYENDRRRQRDAYAEFWSARVSYHALELAGNASAVDLFHLNWLRNGRLTTDRTPVSILARHGGMPPALDRGGRKPEWLLYADLSSLLMAFNLGVLNDVIETFSPIYISQRTIPSIARMRDALSPVQPSRLEAQKAIHKLLQGNMLQALELAEPDFEAAWPDSKDACSNYHLAVLQEMHRLGGRYIASLPFLDKDAQPVSSDILTQFQPTLTNTRALIEALREFGPLSQNDFERALSELHSYGAEPVFSYLDQCTTSLYLDLGVAETLAGAGLLELVCHKYSVCISTIELDKLESDVELNSGLLTESQTSLSVFIQRLSGYLESGTMATLPLRSGTEITDDDKSALACFYDVAAAFTEGSSKARLNVLWCEDRHLQAATIERRYPVLGSYEILQGLLAADSITREQYWKRLLLLRKRYVLFIPLEVDELTYHLSQATNDGPKLRETLELAAIRRYVSHSISRKKLLLRPSENPKTPIDRGEMDVLLNVNNVARSALAQIWSQSYNDHESAIARSEWILDALYCSSAGLLHSSDSFRDVHSEEDFEYTDLLALLLLAVQIDAPTDGGDESRKVYLRWAYDRFLASRIRCDRRLPKRVAQGLSEDLGIEPWTDVAEELKQSREGEQDISREHIRTAALRLYGRLLEAFPDVLFDQVSRHLVGFESLGFRTTVQVLGRTYSAEDFYNAAVSAINGSSGKCECQANGEMDTFIPPSEGSAKGGFHIQFGSSVQTVDDEIFGILAETEETRRELLDQHADWLGVLPENFEDEARRIASLASPQQRFESLERERNDSALGYYTSLHHQVARSDSIRFDLFSPPLPEKLLIYLMRRAARDSAYTFPDDWKNAIESHLLNGDFRTVFNLAASLPVPLPKTLIKSFYALEDTEQDDFVENFRKAPLTPLARIHAIQIIADGGLSRFNSFAHEQLDWLLSDTGQSEIEAFLDVLTLAAQSLSAMPETFHWSTQDRLAAFWFHGSELFGIMRCAERSLDSIGELCSNYPVYCTEEILRPSKYRCDVAGPENTGILTFLIPALSYAKGHTLCLSNAQKDLLRKLAYISIGGTLSNSVRYPLVQDPNCLTNLLGSFLSEDRSISLSNLLEEDTNISPLAIETRKLVTGAVETLCSTPQDSTSWMQLSLGLGSGPHYHELEQSISQVLAEVDLKRLLGPEVEYSESALVSVMARFNHMSSEVILERLKGKLLDLAKSWPPFSVETEEEKELLSRVSSIYLQLLFIVTYSKAGIEEQAAYASDLLVDVSTRSEDLRGHILQLTRRLCNELPPKLSRYFWKTRILLRTL